MTSLQPQVFLYIPTRKNNTGLVLLNTEKTDNVWTMTPAETNYEPAYSIVKPATSKGEFLCTILIKGKDSDITFSKRLRHHEDIAITCLATGATIRVVSMAQHTAVFGSHTLKANVVFAPSQEVSNGIPADSPINPNIIVHAIEAVNPNLIQHITPVIHKKYKFASFKDKETGLNPFVAKKLLELAILQKEICPITAEEFSASNTAVMPCGHVFMRFAIEESFKKERNKCPWCRQQGAPTFV